MSNLFSPTNRRIMFLFLLVSGLVFFSRLHSNLQNTGTGNQAAIENEENEAAVIEQYFQYRADQMKDKSGTIPDGALIEALNERESMERQQESDGPLAAGIDNSSWAFAGPGNVGGRIRAILPINASTVFVGGVSGGIWKTTNCCSLSTTWDSIDDFMANLAVVTLIVDPTNAEVMYAGTGEGFNNADAVRGAGVFKSTDGGAIWTQLASTNNSSWYYVNRLAISPDGVNLLAATSTGLYHSIDGGNIWTLRVSGNWKDVRFDPTNSNNAVAGGSGYSWYTTNGGASGSWAAATGLPGAGRIELAYAPSNTSIVYASVDQNSGEVYKSTDGGHSYTLVNTGTGYLGTQGGYDNTIWVNPTDPNNIVVAGLDIYQSTNGGTTFTKISAWAMSHPSATNPPSPHADHHALVSIPGSSTALLNGNDGGLYYTADIATAGNNPPTYNNGWVELNNNLGITQFYGVAGNNNGVLYGGAQDNGVSKYTGTVNAWTFTNGGDGGKSAADPTNPNYMYNEYIYGKVNRSTGSGGDAEDIWGTYYNGSAWVCRSAPYVITDACNGVGNFIAPILLDPNDANRLFVGDLSLWVTEDARTPYVWNSPTGGPSWTETKPAIGNAINAIAVAPSNSNVIWVGYKNGRIDMTTNWTDPTPDWTQVDTNIGAGYPGTAIGSIAIDKNDSNIVYVGFWGFGPNRVWRTADSGTTWTNITNNLPQTPIYAIAVNPANSAWLYVGTEVGVFTSEDTGGTWNVPSSPGGDGPANVAVFDLQWMGGGNSTGSTVLIAGTHGRGAWTVDVTSPANMDTYADPLLGCDSFTPCYATINEALTNVATSGTVTIYAGTYPESVTVNKNVTVNVLGDITTNDVSLYNGTTWYANNFTMAAGNVNLFGGTWNANTSALTINDFNLTGGTWNADSSTLTINGNWTGGGTFNAGTGMVVFAKNGDVTVNLPAQTAGTLSFCNLTIDANTTVDTTDDFISAATGGSCTQYIQNGKLRREAPQQTVINYGAFTFKDARNRDSVILQKQSGNSLWYTNITITSNQQPPSTCGASTFPGNAVLRQFDLTSTGGTAPYGPYRMRLYFSASNPNEANGNTVIPPYTLAIYHCNGTSWEKYTSTGGSDANGVYVESTVASWSTGSVFAIGYSGTIYYSQGSGDAGTYASWNTARNGTGSPATTFTGPDMFVIQNGHSMTTTNALSFTHADSLLQIESGGALTVDINNVSVMGAQIDSGGTLTMNTGRTLTITNGSRTPDVTVSGTITNAGTVTTTGSLAFNNGGKYQHNYTITNGTVPTATWNTGSTVEFIGYTTSSATPSGLGQTFSNFTWNCPSQSSNPNMAGNLTTVNENFSIISTGTGSLRLISNSPATMTLNIGGDFQISGGTFNSTNGTTSPTVNVGSNVTLTGGTLDAGNGGTGAATFNVAGNWTNNGGTFTPRTGTVNFNGTLPQTIGGSASTTFNSLTLNNASGATLGANETVNGTLTLTSGKITTGANALILGSSGSISGAGAGQYINGNLRKTVNTGSPTLTFEVGGASNYAPISVLLTNVTTGGSLTGSTTDNLSSHSAYASAGFTDNYINRYWTLTQSGLAFTSYEATFTFAAGDYIGSPDPAKMVIRKYSGTWDYAPSLTTATATSATASGFTSFSDFAVGNDASTTPVTLSYFKANRVGGNINFDWSTATESGNIGFNLYAEDGVRLNTELIPSQKIDSLNRLDYSFSAGTSDDAFYIEGVNLLGQAERHGPFKVGQEYGNRVTENKIDWEAIRIENGTSPQSRQDALKPDLSPASANSTSLNLTVNQTGLYRVSYEMLRDAGLNLAGVASSRITLTNRGVERPIYMQSGSLFGPGSTIEFYGQALDTIYTDNNIYTLQLTRKAIGRIPVDNRVPAKGVTPSTAYTETLKVNNQRAYANYAPGKDAWYDTEMLTLTTPKNWSFPFQVDGLNVAAPSQLELVIWGVTDWTQDLDHHLQVSLNGVPLANEIFDGLVEKNLKLNLPAGVLREGLNTLQLTLPGDTGVEAEVVTLDKFNVTYQRAFQAKDGRLTFTEAGQVFKVTNLPGKNVIVYRTDKNGTVKLGQVQVRTTGSTSTATFAGTSTPATYLVTTTEALYSPSFVATRQRVNLNRPAQYLIISHPDFISGIQPLVQAHQAQGLTVHVVDVTDLYAQYSYGVFDPQAIQKYIAYAVKNLGTQYVLLVGGDTYDYRNYLGVNSISFIPSLYAKTGPIANFVPADPLYADINQDNAPDLAIGRFPVRNANELDMMVNKTLSYAGKNYGRSAVFASDINDGNTSFKNISLSISSSLPSDWTVENIHLDDTSVSTARGQLIAAMNRGTALVTFTGHSGPQEWTFSNLFNIQNAASLTNAGKPFTVVQWGCWNNYYVDPIYNYLVQSFLLSGDRGAAAVLGATTLADANSEQLLGQLLTPRLAQPGLTLGHALQLSKSELAQTHPELLDVLLGWSLMGDPALVIQP